MFDTTELIHAISGKSSFEEGSISIITLIEVLRGIEDEGKREKTMDLLQDSFQILDVNQEVVQAYMKLHFEMKRKRVPHLK